MRCFRLVGWQVPTNSELGKDQCNLHWTLPSEKNMHFRLLFAIIIFRISWILNGICIEPFCRKRSSWQPQRLSSWQPVLEWHVTAVSAHPLGLSHQWKMSSSLLACWSLQSCLGASCVRSVSYLFFISQGVKAQFNHTWCKSGPKHFLFHLQLFWSKLSHAFLRMGIEINVLEKGCHLDNHEYCHPYYQQSYPCMYISQVPANGLCIITIDWAL